MNRTRPTALRRMAGITLIELMVVVMVIGVLGVIALPSYRQYSMRAQRTEAKQALLQLAANEERFYLANRRYATTAELAAVPYPVASENGVYDLAVTTNAGWTQDFTATATPSSSGGTNNVNMTQDIECASFSLSSTGNKTATNGKCW